MPSLGIRKKLFFLFSSNLHLLMRFYGVFLNNLLCCCLGSLFMLLSFEPFESRCVGFVIDSLPSRSFLALVSLMIEHHADGTWPENFFFSLFFKVKKKFFLPPGSL